MDAYRTPDERFAALPGFPYAPRYRDWHGLRLAHVDEGEGPPVVMLHGQPTWSYLFRKVMAPLLGAGYRCVVPDLPGFGRSDKPRDEAWYSYERHVAAVADLIDTLDLRDVTLVMHDWGGPIGLRAAVQNDRVARFAIMDSVLVGEQHLGEFWDSFRDLVFGRPHVPTGRIVKLGCRERPPREVVAAYDAPFPDGEAQAGVRAFPKLIPFDSDHPTSELIRETMAAIHGDERDALLLWAEHDPIFPRERFAGQLEELVPRGGRHTVVAGAGHFLQEDRGDWIGSAIRDWVASQAATAAPMRSP
jgi:haloalkane dehalogenase